MSGQASTSSVIVLIVLSCIALACFLGASLGVSTLTEGLEPQVLFLTDDALLHTRSDGLVALQDTKICSEFALSYQEQTLSPLRPMDGTCGPEAAVWVLTPSTDQEDDTVTMRVGLLHYHTSFPGAEDAVLQGDPLHRTRFWILQQNVRVMPVWLFASLLCVGTLCVILALLVLRRVVVRRASDDLELSMRLLER